jgi:hypothetical protein
MDDTFMFSGGDLSDEFMGAFIEASRFQGGAMSATARGNLQNFLRF